jgi:hypothetical protein
VSETTTKPLVSNEFKAVFIPAEGEDFGADAQSAKIAEMLRDGWDWQGFVTMTRVNTEMHASETAGTMLYFRKVRTDVEHVLPGEVRTLAGRPSRQVRRAVARERARIGDRIN